MIETFRIRFHEIEKRYRSNLATVAADSEIRRHDCVVITSHIGAGQATPLRTVAGLETAHQSGQR